MTLPSDVIGPREIWMAQPAPCNGVVVSSRARFARNVAQHPFAPHAAPSQLEAVREEIRTAFRRSPVLSKFHNLDLTEVTGAERRYLKEARLISREMERGGANRAVYVAPDLKTAVLVNEEDHLRLQCLEPGLQLGRVHAALRALDAETATVLGYAYHPRFGFLTACPTNVGTGLRVSVMMHLPGLAMRREDEIALKAVSTVGLTVRGFHGENSEVLGDLYQVSNEVTLGRTVEQIEALVAATVTEIMALEMEARSLLLREGGAAVEDAIWRSYGVLTHARRINTAEAMRLLSRLRMGIDGRLFNGLTHETINRLIMEVQPGHLVLRRGAPEDGDQRDEARASMIRELLAHPTPGGPATP